MKTLSSLGASEILSPFSNRIKLASRLSLPNQDIQPYLSNGAVCYNAATFFALLIKKHLNPRDFHLLDCNDKSSWNNAIASYPSFWWDGKKPIPDGSVIVIRRHLPNNLPTELAHVVAILPNTHFLVKGINGSGKFSNSWTSANGLHQMLQNDIIPPENNAASFISGLNGFKLDFSPSLISQGYKYLIEVIDLQ